MRRIITLVLMICFVVVMSASCGGAKTTAVKFPERDLAGIISFGAGGGTDTLMRPLAKYSEEFLGKTVIMQNKTGGSGSIAAQFVYDGKPDGYTLFMSAENPAVYDAFEISKLTYQDFEPILLIGDETVTIYVNKNSKFKTFKELVDYQLANPGKLTKTGSGPAGISGIAEALITNITGAKFTQYTIDSDAASLAAILGGHADFALGKVQAIQDYYKKGEVKILAVLAKDRLEIMPDVPAITEDYPAFAPIFPWGSFYVVAAHKDTPAEAKKALADAFSKAYAKKEYQELLKNLKINPLGLTGEDAKKYINNWRKNVVEALSKAGAIKKTPAELGIK